MTTKIAWLICAATRFELETFRREGEVWNDSAAEIAMQSEGIVCAVTGVGMPETWAKLLPLVQEQRPQRILNIGIAGAYPNSGLHIGELVQGTSETFGDMGFELPDAPHFQPLTASPFGAFYAPVALTALPFAPDIKAGAGCTVNACTGTEATGRRREQQFGVHFETMEGAAVAQIGRQCGVPVCELRAVSNSAARRDMRPEHIALALQNLRRFLQECREEGIFSCAN